MAEKKIITVEINGEPALNSLAALQQKAGQIKKALQNLNPETDMDKIEAIRKEYEAVEKQIENVKQITGLTTTEMKKIEAAANSFDVVNKKVQELRKQLNALSPESEEFKQKMLELKEAESQLEGIKKQLNGIEQATQETTKQTSKFSDTLSQLTKATFWLYIAQLIYEWGKAFLGVAVDVKNLRAEIGLLTDTTGKELDNLAIRTQAISKTFGVETKDLTIAANNYAKQMGISFKEAFDLMEKGFVNGANANGEFLDKLKEYPIQFKEAEISQETFIKAATMEVKNGIYSDKFLDSIKEVGLSLREMTKAQQDALTNAFGGDFTQKLLTDINTGTITTEQAFKRIMTESDKTGLSVQQMQTLTADVFKGAGEDVGGAAKVWEVYKDVVASSLEPQNEYAKKQREILESEKEVAAAQNEFAKVLEQNTGGYQLLVNKGLVIATKAFTMLFEKVSSGAEIFFNFIDDLGDLGKEMGLISDETDLATTAINALSFVIDILLMPLRAIIVVANTFVKAWTFITTAVNAFIATSPRLQAFFDTIGEYLTSIGEGLSTVAESFGKAFAMIGLLPEKKTIEVETKTTTNGKTPEQIKAEEEEKARLQKEAAERQKLLTEENKKAAEQALKDAQKLAEQKLKDAQKAYEIEQKLRLDSITDATEKAKEEARIQAEKQDLEIQQLQISEEKKAALRLQVSKNLNTQIAKIETDSAKVLEEKIKELEEKLQQATAEYNKTTQDLANKNALGQAQGNVTAAEMSNDPQKIFEAKMALLAQQQAIELQNLELTEGEKFAIEQKYAQQKMDLAQMTAEAKQALIDKEINAVETGVTAFGEAMGKQTEIGRAALQTAKALNAAQVTMSSIVEVQKIWENANANPLNAIIPGWGFIYATAATAAAIGRSMKAIADINSTKYADGGLLKGPSHDFGGVKINVGGRRMVEAEGGEMIVNKRATANNLQAAWALNKFGANTKFDLVPRFAEGGLLPNTTPRMPMSAIQNQNFDNSPMNNIMQEGFMLIANKLDQYDGKPVYVLYTDIESAGSKIAQVRTD